MGFCFVYILCIFQCCCFASVTLKNECHFNASFVELPLVTKVMPKGDYVCANEATMIMCHYDRPADVVNVLWNVPGQSNIDLSIYVGHVMNYTSMSEGSVFVIVEDAHNLLGFYECSVVYRMRFQTSSNSFVPNRGMCGMLTPFCHYVDSIFSSLQLKKVKISTLRKYLSQTLAGVKEQLRGIKVLTSLTVLQ